MACWISQRRQFRAANGIRQGGEATMDDKNNVNRPYDDFFRRPEERSGLNGRAGEEGSGAADGGADAFGGAAEAGKGLSAASGGTADAAGGTAAKPVYYYSYGPFRSGGTDR